jgi:hypothetical protein
MWLPENPLKDEERVEFSKDPSWKVIFEEMTGNVVTSGMVDFMYVILSMVEYQCLMDY